MHCVVLEDENDGKEDNVDDDDEHNSNATPLQRDDATHPTVGLTRRHGPNALRVRRQSGTLCRSGVVGERRQIHLDTVPECRKLENNGESGKDEQRDPKVGQAVLMVDMASRAKPKRDSTGDESDNDTNERNAPADNLGEPHEVPAYHDLPANLEMERQRSQKHPDNSGPTSEDQEGARGGTDGAGLHRMRRNGVEALARLRSERNDKSEL